MKSHRADTPVRRLNQRGTSLHRTGIRKRQEDVPTVCPSEQARRVGNRGIDSRSRCVEGEILGEPGLRADGHCPVTSSIANIQNLAVEDRGIPSGIEVPFDAGSKGIAQGVLEDEPSVLEEEQRIEQTQAGSWGTLNLEDRFGSWNPVPRCEPPSGNGDRLEVRKEPPPQVKFQTPTPGAAHLVPRIHACCDRAESPATGVIGACSLSRPKRNHFDSTDTLISERIEETSAGGLEARNTHEHCEKKTLEAGMHSAKIARPT